MSLRSERHAHRIDSKTSSKKGAALKFASSDEGFTGILVLCLLGLLGSGSSLGLGSGPRPVPAWACAPAYLQTVALGSAGLLKDGKGCGVMPRASTVFGFG